jgi:basic membrane protein A
MQAAEERGKYAISYNSPMEKFAPKAVLTGPVWNWGPYYVKRVKAAMEGTWESGQYWGPMSDGIVGLAPFSAAVPPAVVKLVEQKKKAIEQKKLHPFAGPVKDNQGRLLVPKGKTVSDREMLIFGWFVEGVEGRTLK